ncbi:integrator complex subunit 6-like [Ictidomys tridecemlineatus]|uniref:integrator complex subunit 6-like n=1 Tax=Ictidomys tridecemlineatus TaxID=43179 RepID=UPI001A9DB5F9|nr:integrator complex subunit 6-like [Ictidomys tridecemlineatus]XP_040144975.1 integrator complex subunit 6-like [Ictidomys tridecemlineatus]
MANKADEFSGGPRPSPRPHKRRSTMSLMSVPEEGEGHSLWKDSTKTQGDDASASRVAPEETVQSDPTTVRGSLATSMAAGSVPFYPLASPPEASTGPSQGGLLLQASGDPFGAGFVSSGPSARDPEVPAMPMVAVVPDPFPQSIEEINVGIKHQLMKEVRQFGRKYEKIFKLLEEVRGPAEVKKQFVEFTIKEAARFKRRDLIKHLEKILEKTGSGN